MNNMKIYFILFLACSMISSCSSQKPPCKLNVFENERYLKKQIPPTICLEEQWEVHRVFSKFDMDGDSYDDLAFISYPQNLKNGDSTRLDIIRLSEDKKELSRYTYYNVLPIYYKWYHYEYVVNLDKEVQAKYFYNGVVPIIRFKMDDNLISFRISVVEYEGFNLEYTFDEDSNSWKLRMLESWVKDTEGNSSTKKVDFQEQSLKDFDLLSYF